jgi:hypothetical protein
MIDTQKIQVVTPWLAGAVFAVATLAQPLLSAQQAQPRAQAADSSTGAEVTVIGCLVRLDTSARRPGTSDRIPSGRPGQPASSGYALKDALVSTGEEPATGPVATRSDREFGLAKGDVDVERFAGHQVVIKGRLPGTAANERSADASHPTPSHDAMIEVRAVRSISASCPPRG